MWIFISVLLSHQSQKMIQWLNWETKIYTFARYRCHQPVAITTPRKCRCPSALAIAPDSTRMALAITTDSTHNIILRRPGRTLWLSLTISRSLHGTDVVTAVTTVGHIITVVCYQTHYRYIGIQKQYRQMVADDDS